MSALSNGVEAEAGFIKNVRNLQSNKEINSDNISCNFHIYDKEKINIIMEQQLNFISKANRG